MTALGRNFPIWLAPAASDREKSSSSIRTSTKRQAEKGELPSSQSKRPRTAEDIALNQSRSIHAADIKQEESEDGDTIVVEAPTPAPASDMNDSRQSNDTWRLQDVPRPLQKDAGTITEDMPQGGEQAAILGAQPRQQYEGRPFQSQQRHAHIADPREPTTTDYPQQSAGHLTPFSSQLVSARPPTRASETCLMDVKEVYIYGRPTRTAREQIKVMSRDGTHASSICGIEYAKEYPRGSSSSSVLRIELKHMVGHPSPCSKQGLADFTQSISSQYALRRKRRVTITTSPSYLQQGKALLRSWPLLPYHFAEDFFFWRS